MERYFILKTALPDCLNRLVEAGEFQYLRRGQPGSGPFLDEMMDRGTRPSAQFVLLDRVVGSDTSRKLSSIYSFVDLRVDKNAGVFKGQKGQEFYSLFLRKVSDLDPPIPFGEGTPLWEKLETTRGRRTVAFYAGPRMVLPIPEEDFQTILQFRPSMTEAPPPDISEPPGVSLAAESELHAYLAENLDLLEAGLQPYDPEKYVEFPTGDGGRIDLLCRDKDDTPVVIELKKGRADDIVVGQLARYLGWTKVKLANGGRVRGLIVANVVSDRLRYAARAIPDVRLVSYEVKFELRSVE